MRLSAVMLCLRHAPHLLHTTFEVRNKALEALAPSRNVLRRLARRQFQSRKAGNNSS